MPVKPLTQSEVDELNGLLERAAIRLEQNKKAKHGEDLKAIEGVLAALRDEPRDE